MAALVDTHVAYRHAADQQRGVLTTRNCEPLNLIGTSASVDLHWTHARVKVSQEYQSQHPISVSVFASLPIPAGWQVLSFRCEVGAQHSFTQVKPVAPGAVSVTADSNKPLLTSFTANIPYSIHAGQSVLCTTIYLAPCGKGSLGTEVNLTVPVGVFPTAVPAATSEWRKAFVVPNASAKLLPKFQFSAEGSMYSAIDGTPTCSLSGANVAKKQDPRRFSVQFDSKDGSLTPSEDIVISVPLVHEEDPINVRVVTDKGAHVDDADRYVLAVSVAPQFPNPNPNIEVVLVLDASLSMTPHADSVREFVKTLSTGLPSSTFVNAMTFGETQTWMIPEGSEPMTEALLDRLQRFATSYQPAHKDTKIYRALRSVYSQPTIEGYARVIVLVTDGSDEKNNLSILSLANSNRHSTRVAALGLGEQADKTLLAKLAEVSNGRFRLTASGSSSFLSDALGAVDELLVPTVCQTRLTFSYDGVDEVPPVRPAFLLPPLLPSGESYVLYGIGAASMRGCTCVVSGAAGGSHLEFRVHTGDIQKADAISSAAGDASTSSIAHQAAAFSRVRTLADFNINSILASSETEELLRLGQTFSVPTPVTAFQQQDGSGRSTDTKMDGVLAPFQYERAAYFLPPPPPTRALNGVAVPQDSAAAKPLAKALQSTNAAAARTTPPAVEAAASIVEAVVASICAPVTPSRLLSAQKFDGSWAKDHPAVLAAFEKPIAEIFSQKPVDVTDDTFTTAWVNKYLAKRFGSERACSLAQKKAKAYLAQKPDAALADEALN